MSSLHRVGGEKGGVGKSVVSRLLCQLFIDQQRPFVAFDADASHPALLRYYAGYASPVDIRRFESCDGMLLAALRGTPAVVDLPAAAARRGHLAARGQRLRRRRLDAPQHQLSRAPRLEAGRFGWPVFEGAVHGLCSDPCHKFRLPTFC